jgi:hypothetical protein
MYRDEVSGLGTYIGIGVLIWIICLASSTSPKDLGLARLVHFIALAYLVATAPGFARFIVGGAFGFAVQSLGRNSLAVFAAGSLMSACGQSALAAASSHASKGIEQFAGLAYTVASIAALFAIAHWIECRNDPARAVGFSATPPLSRAWRALRSSSSR